MNTIAITENGTVTEKTWFNNDSEQTSELVFAGDIPEIIGDMSTDELGSYKNLDDLNKDLYGISFSECPKY